MDNEQQRVEQRPPLLSGRNLGAADGQATTDAPGRSRYSRVLPPLLAVSLSTALLYGATAYLRPPPGPHLRLPQLPLDLGRGEPHTSPRGTFQITNSGSEDLTFKITPSCGCTELEPSQGALEPGDSRTIAVAVRLEGRKSRRQVQLTFDTNEPDRRQSYYAISARCDPLLDISPVAIDFGEVPEGTVLEKTLRARLAEHSSLTSLDHATFSLLDPSFEVDTARRSRDEIELLVRLKPQMAGSLLTSTLELSVPGREPLGIPVRATVVGEVTVAPQHLWVGSDPDSEQYRPVTFVVRANGRATLGDLRNVHAPRNLQVRLLSSNGRQAAFQLQVSGIDVPADASVALGFGGLKAPVIVPIRRIESISEGEPEL